MRRLFFVPVAALAAFLLFAPAQVRADGVDNFTFSETIFGIGSVSITWQLPSTPDSTSPNFSPLPGGFALSNVPATLTIAGISTPVLDAYGFFDSGAGYGFEFLNVIGAFFLGGVTTMFSGGASNPAFIPGVYSGYDANYLNLNGAPNAATLTIVGTPEPSSILLLLTGFLVLSGLLFAKKAAA